MERNAGIDYFRFILCLLVISIHLQPLSKMYPLTGSFISNGIARIAVPCFFMISGYFFLLKPDDKKSIYKHLFHLSIVYIVWSLIYMSRYYQYTDLYNLIKFAVMGYYHLWFLPALIIGLLMLLAAKKLIENDKLILTSAIILFLTGYIFEYMRFSHRIYCNGIFLGYPFIVLGYYIRKNDWAAKLRKEYLYPLFLVGLIALFLESYIKYKFQLDCNYFISLWFLCPALFIWILKTFKSTTGNNYIGKIASGVYYNHILVITFIYPLSETDNIYKLPLIIAVSIVLSIFTVLINKYVKVLL